MKNLRRSYDEFTITNMLIFEKSYDDFMILSYEKVMITKNFTFTIVLAKRKYKQNKWRIC